MKNIMIDLETMGQKSNAAIISIGAVYFDNSGLGSTFSVLVDLDSSVEMGMDIDASTVMWWMKQSEDARSVFTGASIHLADALFAFSEFVEEGCTLWGNGADFDNVILANAYDKCNIPFPFKFWNNRCYRTMKNIFRDVEMDRKGIYHNALDDAISQAEHLVKIANEKGIKL